MPTTPHTPLPWQGLPEEVGRDYIRIRGTVLGSRYKIANVLAPNYAGMYQREIDETRANAALIVHAVNNHDALVAALEGLIKTAASWHLTASSEGQAECEFEYEKVPCVAAAIAVLTRAKEGRS